VHIAVTRTDLEHLPSLESEYQKAADMIRNAVSLGARVIAFDVIFGRGTETMNAAILSAAKAARERDTRVVFAEALLPSSNAEQVERVRSFPHEERQKPAGLINVTADADGVFRHYDYARRVGDRFEPSLAMASYLAWRDIDWEQSVSVLRQQLQWQEIGPDFVTLETRGVPVAPVLLNMRAKWSSEGPAAIRTYTVAQLDAMAAQAPAGAARPLDNAILFVSYTGAGLGDVGTTSLSPNQPRVFLHSTALNDLIQQSWLRRLPRWADLLLLLFVVGTSMLAALSRRTALVFVWWVITLGCLAAGSVLLVVRYRWVGGVVFPGCISTLITGGEVVRRYSNELLERLKLRTTMSLYFSPRVMERVLADPGSMDAQEAELTLLLTDIRNSTSLAELIGASGMFALLNQVFEAETTAVMAQEGNLEHFLGDQFLTYWGAPNPQPDGADRATRAAMQLIESMEALRATLTPEVKRLFGYGVALHSGMALVGNKGSAKRLDYGLVGDLVNAAARVESLTKYYGVLCLMTRETHRRLQDPPPVRLIDDVIVKGRHSALELLEVRHAFSPAHFERVREEYEAAYALYRAGDFGPAEKIFAPLAEEGDRPSQVMLGRCQELLASPPEEWRGVYELHNK
jgi:adenylate cyclase